MDLLWEDSGALYIKETVCFQPFSCTTHQFEAICFFNPNLKTIVE